MASCARTGPQHFNAHWQLSLPEGNNKIRSLMLKQSNLIKGLMQKDVNQEKKVNK